MTQLQTVAQFGTTDLGMKSLHATFDHATLNAVEQ
jgi:hypothetical protein